jgi:hypothetical protein
MNRIRNQHKSRVICQEEDPSKNKHCIQEQKQREKQNK